jgi:hypothetical protein
MNQEKELFDKTIQEGTSDLLETFNAWSSGLSNYSVQATYAIIAANWAVFASADSIMKAPWALWSIGVCVLFLSINILGVGVITEMHHNRLRKALHEHKWWMAEYECRNEKNSEWPYTVATETWSLRLRLLKIVAPLIAGFLFIIAIYDIYPD